MAMKKKKTSKANAKVQKVMHEWKTGTLHSGGPKGPIVTSRKQAIAIAMSEAHMPKRSAVRRSKRKPAIEGK